MLMRIGLGHACRLSSNGNVSPSNSRFAVTLLNRNFFTRSLLTINLTRTKSSKCSETFGNGPEALILPILATAPSRGLSANTTENLCAINTCSVAALVQPHAPTFVRHIAIFSNQKNAGSLQGFDWPETPE